MVAHGKVTALLCEFMAAAATTVAAAETASEVVQHQCGGNQVDLVFDERHAKPSIFDNIGMFE